MIPVTEADLAGLDDARGSLSSILPGKPRLVTIGNGHEVHRVTELVARGGPTGNRMVANLHSVASKKPRIHVELHELLDVKA